MKICPNCQTTYDDAQNFCLNDGTSLVFVSAPPSRVEPLDSFEEATVVKPSASPSNIAGQQSNYATPPISSLPASPPVVVEKKANTGKIIALTALATVLLISLAAGGAYLAFRNRNSQQVAQANANANTARPRNANSASANAANSVNANANVTTNVNANVVNANVLPSPKPTLNEAQARAVRENVTDTIADWADSTENGDIESHVSFYAPTVDYYKGGNVSSSRVRSDRQKAFETYSNIDVEISNVKVTPDSSGEKATVIFDKAWHFENDTVTSEGKVQQQLTLEKRGDRWLITGEKDLKDYGSTKY